MSKTFGLWSTACLGGVVGAVALGSASLTQAAEINVLTANEGSCTVYSPHVAEYLGFYDDMDIQQNLLASETTVPYVAFLSTGDADLVMLDSAQVYQMANAGQEASVIYEVMQKAPEGLIVMADSDLQSLEDLKGQIVGLASDRDQITTAVTLHAVGMSIDDVETVVVGDQGPLLATSLKNGAIQGYAGSGQDFVSIEAAGIEVRDLTPAEVSQNVGNSFAIADERAEEIRDLVTGYLRGWSMANLASVIDIKAAASACRQGVPEQWEDLASGWAVIYPAVFDLNLRRTMNFGEPQPDVWANVQRTYVELGELPTFIEPSEFLDDSFIPGINDFTTEEVKEAINTYKEENPEAQIP